MADSLLFTNDFKKRHKISADLSHDLNGFVERYRKEKLLSRADIVRDALRQYFAIQHPENDTDSE